MDAVLSKEPPDLILLDISMPVMSGLDACKIIKNDPRSKDTPIVMLTARGQGQDEKAGISAGADFYETKPFSPKLIVERVSSILFEGMI
ncbi:MAG: response regulator [Actinomycetota bacterium]|nr:response regulator [Actinomycetota bacterium]